jgi:hypothetical protein
VIPSTTKDKPEGLVFTTTSVAEKFATVTWSAVTTTLVMGALENPEAVADTVYVPAGSPMVRKLPLESVTAPAEKLALDTLI